MRSTQFLLFFLASGLALAGSGCSQAPPPPSPSPDVPLVDVIAAAIADPGREAQKAADARRRPLPLMILAGAKPGDHVLDLIPGNGYWTRIFSKIVGPDGKVHAVWPHAYARFAAGNVEALKALSGSAPYANIKTLVQPSTILGAPERLDVVWTSQNYHDYPAEFMGKTDPASLNRAVFDMLKPGGTYVIVDHRAAAGRGMADVERLHRIDPSIVRRQVEAAGFVFAGESEVLANRADPLDIPVFDP